MKTKDRPHYQAVSISKEFIRDIKEYVLKSNRYRSIADFTRQALREKMDGVRNIEDSEFSFCPFCGNKLR